MMEGSETGAAQRIAVSVLAMLIVSVGSFAANFYYQPKKPVMSFLTAVSSWQFGEGWAQVTLYGLKDRDECAYIKNSERGLALIAGEVYKEGIDKGIHYEWVDAHEEAETFPAGYIQPDPSRWSGELVGVASKLGIDLSHDCDGVILDSRYWYNLPNVGERK